MSFVTKENPDLNQYWYSDKTIDHFVKEITAQCKVGAAFLSTPSLYFSLPADSDARKKSKVFEFDRQWESDPGFVFYDYTKPEHVNIALFGQFDVVVIDPPFITEECWELYAKTTKLLLCPGGKVICTTIAENEGLMQRLMGCSPVPFQPSIPNLVYQYNTYTSYTPTAHLESINDEIASDPQGAAKEMQRAMLESREQFISMAQNRYGRDNEAAIPVSLAGKYQWNNVPKGMTEYPETGVPAPEGPVDYGSEYDEVMLRRTRIGDASKLVDKACKPLDKIAKATAAQRTAETAGHAERAAKHQHEADAGRAQLAELLKELADLLSHFPEREEGSPGGLIAEAISFVDVDTTDITADWAQKLATDVQMLFKSPLFNHQKALLARLKELKKAHNTNA